VTENRWPPVSPEELEALLRVVRPRVQELAARFGLSGPDVARITRDVAVMVLRDRNPGDRERLFVTAFERQCERLRLERESDDGPIH